MSVPVVEPPARVSSSLWLTSAALAGVLTGLGDGLLALRAAPDAAPGGVAFEALLACVGLYAAPALLLGACLWLVSASARGLIDVRAASIATRLRDERADLALCAALLAGLGCLGVVAALVYAFGRGFAVEMANKRNAALSTALVAAAAVPLSAPAFFPAYRAARVLARLLPRPRTLAALALCLLLGAAVVVLAVLSVDWRAIHFGPFKALLAFGACLALGRAALGRLGLGQPPLLRHLLLLSLVSALLLPLSFTLGRFGAEPRARALVAGETALAKSFLGAGRRLFDRDGDGYAGRLGGGDCDDRDPAVHPGAEDVPGDGVDQDCEDGDARPEPAAAVVPTAPAAAAAPGAQAGKAPDSAPAAPAAAGGPARWDGSWLVITIDTLRADRVSAKVTPNLWSLAEQGARFTDAYAQAPNTPRSFPSFLTSRLPSQVHFVRQSLNFSPVTGKDPTLFTELSGAGFRTIGLFSHFYLDERTGLSKGFDEWKNDGATTLHDSNSDIAAPRITARVVARLKQLGAAAREAERRGEKPARFALWTHLFDPHSTYMDHPEFPVEKGFKHIAERYDAEVAFTDLHVGKILKALQEAGLSERTAIVVFADHGESFGEHRMGGEPLYFHGESLYDEVLRVPLLLKVPGLPPQRIDDRVMLIDLAPTVLELAGVGRPASFRGRSLVPRLLGQPLPPQPAYAEMLPCTGWQKNERALISGDYKLYARFTDGQNELYEVSKDRAEQRNLAGAQPERLKELKAQLSAYMRGAAIAP